MYPCKTDWLTVSALYIFAQKKVRISPIASANRCVTAYHNWKPKLERVQEKLLPTWGLSSSSPSLFSLTAATLLLFSISRLWLLLMRRLRWHAFFCSIKSLLELFGSHLTYGQVQQKQTMMANVYLMLPKKLVGFLWCGCAYQECQAGCHLSLSDTPLHSGH